MLVSSSSQMLDADPMLSDLPPKLVFRVSSIGDGGMKVTSFFSKGLMVTVIIGFALCGLTLPFVMQELKLSEGSGMLFLREFSFVVARLK